MIKVLSVNKSFKKGEPKTPLDKIDINLDGIIGDAHSGKWHRQISLLASESINELSKLYNTKFNYGDFAENITTKGFPLHKVKIFDRFISNDVELMVSQIGKKCHQDGCSIFQKFGKCVMPKEGIFCKVISGGALKVGDTFTYRPKVFKVKVVTLSDRASSGIYQDKSGKLIKKLTQNFFNDITSKVEVDVEIISDEKEKLLNLIDKTSADIIFTTGGTGVGERDITVDVVKQKIKKDIPGIMELIRVKYGKENPNALLSRAVAGVLINKTLIYTLPGSQKAVSEYLNEILKTLIHTIKMVWGIDSH